MPKSKFRRFVRRFLAWNLHAIRDLHAWVVSMTAIVAGAGAQFLAGLDPAAFLAMTKKEQALRILIALAPGVLLHIATARQHQDAAEIVKKLAAAGYQVTPPPAPPAQPGSAP